MSESANEVISQDLLEILVCPLDHATLKIEGATLRCTVCGRVYQVEDGIPNMLVDDE